MDAAHVRLPPRRARGAPAQRGAPGRPHRAARAAARRRWPSHRPGRGGIRRGGARPAGHRRLAGADRRGEPGDPRGARHAAGDGLAAAALGTAQLRALRRVVQPVGGRPRGGACAGPARGRVPPARARRRAAVRDRRRPRRRRRDPRGVDGAAVDAGLARGGRPRGRGDARVLRLGQGRGAGLGDARPAPGPARPRRVGRAALGDADPLPRPGRLARPRRRAAAPGHRGAADRLGRRPVQGHRAGRGDLRAVRRHPDRREAPRARGVGGAAHRRARPRPRP